MSERKPSQRFHSLNTEQVEVLHQVLSEVVPIHGRGNFPTLELRPRDIIITVRARLQKQGITVRDVRLNGSTASHVLVQDNGTSYKDLDIIFGVELPTQEEFQVIKESVLGCLLDCLPAGVNKERISSATMKEAYVQKMVKVFNEHDRWSLISLSNNSGKNLELKFVSALRRQFEFSVDSFQIILDRLLESYMKQELQHRMKSDELKDGPEEGEDPIPETDKCSPGRDLVSKHGAQAEVSQKTEHFNQTKHSTIETENKDKIPTEMKGEEERRENFEETDQISQNVLSDKKKNSGSAEPQAQTELRHKPEPLDETKCSPLDHKVVSDEKEMVNHTNSPSEQTELAEQTEQAKMPETSNKSQAENPHGTEQSDKTNLLIYSSDEQRSNEEDEIQHVSAQDADRSPFVAMESQSVDEREAGTETSEDTQAGSQNDIDEIKEETSESEIKHADNTQGINGSSSTLTVCNTQDTLETHSTQDTEDSEKTSDALSPSNTQDVFPAPPNLVTSKKTSSSSTSSHPQSGKASERISHMVVLKHSSPKPPRRMCRKITPSPHPCPLSESELLPFLDSNHNLESELTFDPNPAAQTTTYPLSIETASGLEQDPSMDSTSNLDFTSAYDPAPDIVSTATVDPLSALPQEPASSQLISEGSFETNTLSLEDTSTTNVAFDEQSQPIPQETAAGPKQSGPPDSRENLDSHADTFNSDTQEPSHTSEDDLSEEAENITGQETKALHSDEANINSHESELNSPSFSHCFTPPVVSLSPACLTPSPQSLSPPPCQTPPSHSVSSPMLSTVSSPPRSFSPTSSCLSSPPYLTPPMLSLSPPPLCFTPPSPCLSPPLLCLTPPVELEDLIPQVSSEVQPLILNTGGDEQIKESSPQTVPLLQLEDEKEQDYIASLPQVAEPVSFLITIPSSTSHVLPHSEPEGSEEAVPPKNVEASNSVPEIKDVPRESMNVPGQRNTPQTDSAPDVEVLAESMYGDFEAAMDHLRYRLIATRNPEEIRGGGLLKYSNLLVRDYRPASETQIKTLERYMCSRFFIDFPDVQEQQRKILSYLKNHFIGEERNKYQYLMTLRRVVDDSTVCLMGHERRQTLNMITVLALKVLGEQNIIPNTDHVTCFYQPAPYLAEHSPPYLPEPSYCSYYIPQGGSTLLYQPYPLHLHPQTGLV